MTPAPRQLMCVAAVPRVLTDPAPGVLLTSFAADGLELTIGFWIDDPENGQNNVRSQVNLAIWNHLKAHGIEVPYPQRVVHQA
ncbi:MAG: mechanosensitive ion channel [Ideonella sp.]|nr:mechanosensitive ion channel [Ideonella sp.]